MEGLNISNDCDGDNYDDSQKALPAYSTTDIYWASTMGMINIVG